MVYAFNWVSTSIVKDKIPKETWLDKKPTVEHFWVFGCDAYAHVLRWERYQNWL